MSDKKHDNDYEVGYRKPPKSGRFVSGQSGNPKGRRRGTKNLARQLHEACEQKMAVKIDGKRKMISRLEAIFTQTLNKAVSGDLQAAREVMRWRGVFPYDEERSEPENVIIKMKFIKAIDGRPAPGQDEGDDDESNWIEMDEWQKRTQ